ncbi:MAG: choice-of-anchor H family protein [Candidatus Thiodiazotropha sp.]
MKLKQILVFSALLALAGVLQADESVERLTQSVEGPLAKPGWKSELDKAEIDIQQPMVLTGSRQKQLSGSDVHAYHDPDFSIFDARTVISRDDDDDGYYHRLSVSFDPDVVSGRAWVYAELYLSLEGGPWNRYYTTESFPIDGDDSEDDYEVVTRLTDGYPSGYYDVLIELYDADNEDFLAEYGPYDDRDLSALPLEDSYRDGDDHYHGGGGALGLSMLLLVLLTRLYRINKSPHRPK